VNIDAENLEARADSDRRRHEDDLLALLLLLLHQSANRADSALNLGADPFQAAADPLTGNTGLRIRPAWPRIARRLYAADLAGFERTVRVIRSGTIEAETDPYVPAVDYNSIARQAAARLVQHTRTAIADGIRRSFTEAKPVRRAVDEAFGAAGLVQSATSKAWLLETTVETLVGYSFNNGWFAGFARPDVAAQLKGWRFSATLDATTTEICRARDGVKVRVGDPWIQRNTPQLHFGCRSVLLPLWRDFTPTETLPDVPPPMAGFGQAPAVVRGLSYFAAA
jgi:hypothetical protein